MSIEQKLKNCPKSWDDVTFEQYAQMTKDGVTDSWIVAALTGLTHKQIQQFRNLDAYHQAVKDLSFISTLPDLTQVPQFVDFQNKRIKITDDLGNIQVIQIEHMKSLMANAKPEDLNLWRDVFAIWLHGEIAEYDYDEALKLREEVEKLPVKWVLGIGSFFLQKSTGYMNGTINAVLSNRKRKKRWRLGVMSFLKSLAGFLPFTQSQNSKTFQKMKY